MDLKSSFFMYENHDIIWNMPLTNQICHHFNPLVPGVH